MYSRVTIGSFASAKGGKRLHPNEKFSPTRTQHPYIRARDIGDGKIGFDDPVYLASDTAERLKRYKVRKKDVCITIVGANVGDVGLVPSHLDNANLTENAAKLVSVKEDYCQHFVMYSLLCRDAQQQMKSFAGGAAQPKLALYKIEEVEIPFPPHSTQRKIAAILSAYDDLIENNTRRIQILEEMAQVLYREWFVHFRFPGHEQSKMVDSAMGPIPEGWGLKKLGDVAHEVRRSININQVDPETPYVGLEHIPRKSIALYEWGKGQDVQSMKLRFDKGDILFGKIRPYFHKVSIAPIDGVCSSDAIVIKAKQAEYYAVTLCCVSSDDFVLEATQTSQGTKMPRANWGVLTKFPIAMPPLLLLSRFNEIILGVVGQVVNLTMKNRNLRQTRDLLLPKLISGEIDVADLDITIGESH